MATQPSFYKLPDLYIDELDFNGTIEEGSHSFTTNLAGCGNPFASTFWAFLFGVRAERI